MHATTAALNEAKAASAPAASDSSAVELERTISNLREELGSQKESAELTKESLVQQIDFLAKNRDRELEDAAEARVQEIKGIKRAHEEANETAKEQLEALRRQLDEERELKNKGACPRLPLRPARLCPAV